MAPITIKEFKKSPTYIWRFRPLTQLLKKVGVTSPLVPKSAVTAIVRMMELMLAINFAGAIRFEYEHRIFLCLALAFHARRACRIDSQ